MANIKKDEVKDSTKDVKEQALLTEAEFEKKQRLKAKERINRVTRVFGVFSILLLSFAGIFEPFFELSYFGRLFTPSEHAYGWAIFSADGVMDNLMVDGEVIPVTGRLFDDWLHFWNPWLAKLGLTVLFIGAFILLVYFMTYTIVDLVDVVKEFIAAGRDITRDLSGNVKDTMGIPDKDTSNSKKKKKKSLFEEDSDVEKTEPKEKVVKKRRTEKNDGFGDLSSEQLDALLSGKSMEEVLGVETTDANSLF